MDDTRKALRNFFGGNVRMKFKELELINASDEQDVAAAAAAALDKVDQKYRAVVADILKDLFGIEKIPGAPAKETLHD